MAEVSGVRANEAEVSYGLRGWGVLVKLSQPSLSARGGLCCTTGAESAASSWGRGAGVAVRARGGERGGERRVLAEMSLSMAERASRGTVMEKMC